MRVLFMFLLVTILGNSMAQKSGVIEYQLNQKLEIQVDNENMEGIDISGMLPSERISYHQLRFNESARTFKTSDNKPKTEDEDIIIESEGFKIEIVQSDIEEQMYIDAKTNQSTELRAFLEAPFIIEAPLPSFSWKITSEKVKYLDKECIKAITTNKDGKEIIAWFAPSIPLSIGPDKYSGLPGAILMLSIDGDKSQYKALSISMEGIDQLEKPLKGKKVSEEEFDQIVEERIKEMTGGRGESFIIRG